MSNNNNNNNKVWIVYTSDGHLGGYAWGLQHICATPELAKKKLIDTINDYSPNTITYDIDDKLLEDPNINEGCGIEEREIEYE